MAATPATTLTIAAGSEDSQNEEELRNQLRQALEGIKKREPIQPSYKHLLMNGVVTSRKPVFPKDKFYKAIGSRLRERVEKFMVTTQGKDPFDRILQRQPLEQASMRSAFTLREAKEYDQNKMLAATLASFPRRNGMDDQTHKRHLEGIAVGLQSRGGKKKKPTVSPTPSATEQTELARQKAELERQRAVVREREEARKRREEQDRRRREEENVRQRTTAETPQQALQKIIQPIFKVLWDMEFESLGGSNPFRIVIDKGNYIAMQVPDYFDVIETPMNLTYIQEKVNNTQYETLQAFFQDVELMLNNALKYNDTNNPYHVAANDMKRKFLKMRKKVIVTLQQKHQAQNK